MGGSRSRGWLRAALSGSALFLLALATSLTVAAPAPAADGIAVVAVATGSDDAEQLTSGWLGLTSSDLELVDEFSPQIVGIRFAGLPIPQGAEVTSAHIQFTVDESSSGQARILVAAHDDASSPTFSAAQPPIGRALTDAVEWVPEPWGAVGIAGAAQMTPDLTTTVQAVVDRPDWVAGGPITFIMTGTGTRTAESFEGGSPPVLTVTWDTGTTTTSSTPSTTTSTTTTAPPTTTTTTSTTVPATTTTTTTTTTIPGDESGVVTRPVVAAMDDVEEQPNGWLYLGSSDLELVTDEATQIVGVRFTEVDVPRGATVTSAWIQFTVDEASSGPATLEIRAGDSGHAPPFAGVASVSGRPRTAGAVEWAVPAWRVVGAAGDSERTPDLSAVVGEVISRPDWVRGNAIAFVLAGNGRRTAYAFDGSPTRAPVLHVEWTTGEPQPVVNQPPTVSANASDTTVGSPTTLAATIDDDGLPVPPGIVFVAWEQIDGPAAAVIEDETASVTTAHLPVVGEYRFRVTVTDGEHGTSAETTATATDLPAPTATTRLAGIGDYGGPTSRMFSLVDLVDAGSPDAVLTTGDNVYANSGFDRLVGRFFHHYIGGYTGVYGVGSPEPRFFPALGNHDYEDIGLDEYVAFFDLPGNERYYDVRIGGVHVFVVNSNPQEPDGLTPTTVQGRWLQSAMAASNSEWKVVVFHHPPFSSLPGKSATWMRWPLQQWGADLVLNGDAHAYERLEVDGVPHVVIGLGINNTTLDRPRIPESRVFWSQDTPAAVFITACSGRLEIETRAVGYGVIDTHAIGTGTCPE